MKCCELKLEIRRYLKVVQTFLIIKTQLYKMSFENNVLIVVFMLMVKIRAHSLLCLFKV